MFGDYRSQKLFIILTAFFVVNAVLAEFIGVKIFALEDTLGLNAFNWNLFGQSGSLNFTESLIPADTYTVTVTQGGSSTSTAVTTGSNWGNDGN